MKFLRVVLSKVGLFHYLVDTILNEEFLKNMFATKIETVLTQYYSSPRVSVAMFGGGGRFRMMVHVSHD